MYDDEYACDHCECYCGGCDCCDEPESSPSLDYNAITPEEAVKRIEALKGHGPWWLTGKSHLWALMARRDGVSVETIELTSAKPEDLSGLPFREEA